MLDFNKYVQRHGECWVEEIVMQIERREGIFPNICVSLEDRWNALMRGHSDQQATLAA